MIFGVSPTRDAVVIAETTGSKDSFEIKSIRSIPFQAKSGDDLTELLQRLVALFGRGGRRSTIAILGSSSGRFKSSVEAIKAEAIAEVAATQAGRPVVKVAVASLKKVLGCAIGQKWQARAAERFNADGKRENLSQGAAGAVAAAFKVTGPVGER
jgi:ethanolamine utilization protein EutA (predicted chaperonin)